MNSPNPRPSTVASEEPHDDAAGASVPLPTMQAIQQLMAERKELEQFAQESYARLNQLRELIREENAAADAVRTNTNAQEKVELERLRTQVRELETQLDAARTTSASAVSHLHVERDLIRDELAQCKQQVENQAQQGAEFEKLLEALVQEVGQREEAAASQRRHFEEECGRLRKELATMHQREQSLNEQLSKARETANKVVQTEQDSGDHAEVAAMIEQVEAEIRQQQEAIRQERAALARERSEFEERRSAASRQVAAAASPAAARGPMPSSTEPRMLRFTCKYCHGAMQAKEWLAGLVTKCQHCGKMAPVPKLGS